LIGQKFEWCVAQEGDTCPLIHEKGVKKERKGKNEFGEGGYLKEKKKKMREESVFKALSSLILFFLLIILFTQDSTPGYTFISLFNIRGQLSWLPFF
jgi:hypothetical protein